MTLHYQSLCVGGVIVGTGVVSEELVFFFGLCVWLVDLPVPLGVMG